MPEIDGHTHKRSRRGSIRVSASRERIVILWKGVTVCKLTLELESRDCGFDYED